MENMDIVNKLYQYLINIGFKDVTNTAIKYLEASNLKVYKNVLDRINDSKYYYILERNNLALESISPKTPHILD